MVTWRGEAAAVPADVSVGALLVELRVLRGGLLHGDRGQHGLGPALHQHPRLAGHTGQPRSARDNQCTQ